MQIRCTGIHNQKSALPWIDSDIVHMRTCILSSAGRSFRTGNLMTECRASHVQYYIPLTWFPDIVKERCMLNEWSAPSLECTLFLHTGYYGLLVAAEREEEQKEGKRRKPRCEAKACHKGRLVNSSIFINVPLNDKSTGEGCLLTNRTVMEKT